MESNMNIYMKFYFIFNELEVKNDGKWINDNNLQTNKEIFNIPIRLVPQNLQSNHILC